MCLSSYFFGSELFPLLLHLRSASQSVVTFSSQVFNFDVNQNDGLTFSVFFSTPEIFESFTQSN